MEAYDGRGAPNGRRVLTRGDLYLPHPKTQTCTTSTPKNNTKWATVQEVDNKTTQRAQNNDARLVGLG